jgi:hypothetical protein
MDVYIITHSAYGYYDGEFFTDTEVFESLESAQVYFELMKTNIIDEYLDYAGVSSLHDMDNDIFYMDDEPTLNGMDYFYMDYDDYAWDRMKIEKKPILAFKEA